MYTGVLNKPAAVCFSLTGMGFLEQLSSVLLLYPELMVSGWDMLVEKGKTRSY